MTHIKSLSKIKKNAVYTLVVEICITNTYHINKIKERTVIVEFFYIFISPSKYSDFIDQRLTV